MLQCVPTTRPTSARRWTRFGSCTPMSTHGLPGRPTLPRRISMKHSSWRAVMPRQNFLIDGSDLPGTGSLMPLGVRLIVIGQIVAGNPHVRTGERILKPRDLHSGEVLDQPEQARARADHRASHGRGRQSGGLPDHRTPKEVQEIDQRFFFARQGPRRVMVTGHDPKGMARPGPRPAAPTRACQLPPCTLNPRPCTVLTSARAAMRYVDPVAASGSPRSTAAHGGPADCRHWARPRRAVRRRRACVTLCVRPSSRPAEEYPPFVLRLGVGRGTAVVTRHLDTSGWNAGCSGRLPVRYQRFSIVISDF